MKVAIIHDWLVTYAGGERALKEIISLYPDADIFSMVDFLSDNDKHFLLGKTVATSFIQNLPFAKKHYRTYLPLMPFAVEQFDLSKYDLILSSSHAVAKGVLSSSEQIHISYIHTPIRYAWDLYHQYLNESGLNEGLKGWIAKIILHYIRLWDFRTANSVDYFLTNSQYVARRIAKLYRRDAEVIFGPVDVDTFTVCTQKEDFYLTASRMVPYKKIDLIVEAFSVMPDKKLFVIGDGPDFQKIKRKAGKNVEILGYQPSDTLKYYMQKAKAFVFAAEEDFGLTPVEAQSCGTPVIAYGRGGACETVIGLESDSPTGVFFHKQDIASVCEAVNLFEEKQALILPDNCRKNAERFSVENFRTNFRNFVDKYTCGRYGDFL